jgi:hypothetical protein
MAKVEFSLFLREGPSHLRSVGHFTVINRVHIKSCPKQDHQFASNSVEQCSLSCLPIYSSKPLGYSVTFRDRADTPM